MNEHNARPSYRRHRFPPGLSGHAAWLCFRLALRHRGVAELLAGRGVVLTDEAVRLRCREVGQQEAKGLRRKRPGPGDTWHPAEVSVQSVGVQPCLRRAVDQAGMVPAIPPRPRRDKRAAVRFPRKSREGRACVPRVVSTDTPARDGAARRALSPGVEPRRHTGVNNRAAHAHQPTRGYCQLRSGGDRHALRAICRHCAHSPLARCPFRLATLT